jgi:uncharacterized protein YgiM (DUF1202 family)
MSLSKASSSSRRFVLALLAVALLFAFLPLPAGAVEAASAAAAPAAQTCQTYHVVQRGENLYRIALKYGTRWPVLAQANNISNPDHIYAGQRLCIPGTATATGTVVNAYYLNVRNGPGVNHGVIEIIARNAQVQILGRNSSSTWVNVRTAAGKVGWVNAHYISSSAPIGSLPVLALAPTDTVASR